MNREVIITGASRGLGLELAKKFIDSGDKVFGISRTARYHAAALAAVASPAFKLFTGDMTSEKSVKNILMKIKRQTKKIDILVNNAGYCGSLTRVEDLPLKEFHRHMAQNLDSAFLMCKFALPVMLKQKKALIINISSMAGTRAVPRLMAYSASKFGVLALSQSIAKENPDAGLKCITVCPGGMNTQMRRDLFGLEDAARQQTPGFVADIISQIVDDKITVLSGGHIVIRYGKITDIAQPPAA